jgi:hypothetical protein
MLDRVQKLHEAAIAAGLPGVLADGYFLNPPPKAYPSDGTTLRLGRPEEKTDAYFVPHAATQAAVAWWLREWCIEHRGVDAFGDPEVRTDIEYLEWAEEIVANRKARPWVFR